MILVLGGTGKVGQEVVRGLIAAQQEVRALVRDPEAARSKLGSSVALVRGDFTHSGSLDEAMHGVERMYLVTPASPALQQVEANVIQAAARARVRHVVKQSNLGSTDEPGVKLQRWHRAGEKLLERSGMAWTFVRPTGFMTNALGWASTIKSQGAVYAPAGEGRLSVVDPRDIAAVAVRALIEPGHEGKAYDLTGPEALTTAEQVATISAVIEKPIKYVDVPPAAARTAMLGMGMPAELADAMLEFMELVRSGKAGMVADSVQRVTGRPARTFEAWARENASYFK